MPPKAGDKSNKTTRSFSSSSKNKDGSAHATGSSNTNDEITCKLCQNVFTDPKSKLMECERCTQWYCQTCGDITDVEFKSLKRKSTKMHWYCDSCNDEAVSAVKTSQLIEDKCRQYMWDMKDELKGELKEELKVHVESEIESVKLEIASVKSTSVTQAELNSLKEQMEQKLHSTDSAEDVIKEVQERQDRRLNIVVFNVQESEAEDAEQRKKADLDNIRAIFDTVGVSVPLAKLTRLGNPAGNPAGKRPIRFKASSEQDVKTILSAAPKLQNGTYRSVFINRDMTPLERAEWKKLVIEKKKRNEMATAAMENTKWIIRNNRVVKERPVSNDQGHNQGHQGHDQGHRPGGNE